MADINQLSSTIYNRIAAGEVVDRPCSVVKELVENAIDALSSKVFVDVCDGGISSITVFDDGDGMDKENLEKCILPHATSKIVKVEDLDDIKSYGFRGEALASIASVSKLRICSCTEDDEIGNAIYVNGGNIIARKPFAMNRGTIVTVNNIFFNTPARAKFLKSPKAEANEVSAMMARFILSNPYVAFEYSINGDNVFQSYGDGLESAFISVYGVQVQKDCFFINSEVNGIKIVGYAGKHYLAKSNRSFQTVFINGRYVINQTISSAINNAYQPYMMKRKYPFCVLNIQMPAGTFDVNVSPNKTEVRFVNNQMVYSAVYSILTKVLDGSSEALNIVKGEGSYSEKASKNIPNTFLTDLQKFDKENEKNKKNSILFEPISFCDGSAKWYRDKNSTKTDEEIYEENRLFVERYEQQLAISNAIAKTKEEEERNKKLEQRKNVSQDSFNNQSEFNVIGQALNTYLIMQKDQDLFFVDQHAAHERLIYDDLIKSIKSNKVVKQPLLVPYVLNLSYEECEFINSKIDNLAEMGIEIEYFGKTSFKINAVPACLENLNFQEFFSNLFIDLRDLRGLILSDVLTEKIAREACRSAIKAGHVLSSSEIDYLIQKLKDNLGLKCPHGRPVCIRITKTEIEKWFKRIP